MTQILMAEAHISSYLCPVCGHMMQTSDDRITITCYNAKCELHNIAFRKPQLLAQLIPAESPEIPAMKVN